MPNGSTIAAVFVATIGTESDWTDVPLIVLVLVVFGQFTLQLIDRLRNRTGHSPERSAEQVRNIANIARLLARMDNVEKQIDALWKRADRDKKPE